MLVMILMMMLLYGVIKAGIRLAWGTTKFLFGLICAGGAAWSLQSSVAADCDCRIAARQRVSKIILTRRIPGGGT